MYRKYTLILLLCLSVLSAQKLQAAYGYFGDCASFVQLNSIFYEAGSCSFIDSPLPGDLGVVSALTLELGEIQTFENGGDDVYFARLMYRIYEQGSPIGGFVEIPMTQLNILGGGDERRQTSSLNIDLLLGLSTGTAYTLEITFEADVDFNPTDGNRDDIITNGSYFVNFETEAPLPVSLSDFRAERHGTSKVFLQWTTESEWQNDYFLVQQSDDLLDWQSIGRVAGAVNSQIQTKYVFEDKTLRKGNAYYRLQQMDLNGQATQSEVVAVDPLKTANIRLSPNPSKGILNIQLDKSAADVYTFRIVDASGGTLRLGTVNVRGDESISLDLSELPQGLYHLYLTGRQHTNLQHQSFVKL
ncbi:MAG: T9SS type A sorting domain-containing protein [Bacteroidota bacterium]